MAIDYEHIPNGNFDGFQRNGITWLASWPKSGNTWVRLFLSAYLRGPENFSLTSPHLSGDSQLIHYQSHSPVPVDQLNDPDIWRLRAAVLWSQYILSRQTNLILKTHTANATCNGYQLIPHDFTHKSIYIVRDPRDVLVSWKRYSETDWEQAWETFSCETNSLRGAGAVVPAFTSSWKTHVKSWLDDDDLNLALLTYEGLFADPSAAFRKVLEFLDIEIEEERFAECIKLTDIRSLRKYESRTGFIENGSGETFFHKGGSRWQDELPQEYVDKILDTCSELMVRLGYLGEEDGSNNGILHERESRPALRSA